MHTIEDLGGIALVTAPLERKTVERELRALDPALFLDGERNFAGGPVIPVVKQHLGSNIPPATVLRWQDEHGNPKPLSGALVEHVRRREVRSREQEYARVVKQAADANQQRRVEMHAQAAEEMDALEREHRARMRAAELDSLPPFWRPRRFGAK